MHTPNNLLFILCPKYDEHDMISKKCMPPKQAILGSDAKYREDGLISEKDIPHTPPEKKKIYATMWVACDEVKINSNKIYFTVTLTQTITGVKYYVGLAVAENKPPY